jgi:hypothetical protein
MINTLEEAIAQIRHIQLDSQYSPREIAQMILAGGSSQSLFNLTTGSHERALQFLCTGTSNTPNYPIPAGIIHEDEKGRPYFVKGTPAFPASIELNEIAGLLAVAGIHFETTPVVTNHGKERTLADIATTAMNTYRHSSDEPSWCLMLFSVFPGVTKQWHNEDGELMSVDAILPFLLKRNYGEGACLGLHAIEGISFAISRFCLEQDVEPVQLEGVWKEAWDYIDGAMRLMEKNQKDDGSIDRCWFREKSMPKGKRQWAEKARDVLTRRYSEPKAIVYPTGHCLDAISPLAMFVASDRPWIYNACFITAKTIQDQWIPLTHEIFALTHAVHALKLLGNI